MATCVARSVRARMVQLVIMLLGSVHVNLDILEQLVTPVRNSILITMLLLMISCISDLQIQLCSAVPDMKRLSLMLCHLTQYACFFF